MTEQDSSNPAANLTFSFESWRESFIKVVLIFASIFGFITYVASFFNSNDFIYQAIYTIAFAVLLVVTFIRLPYTIRAYVFLGLVYLLGLSGLFETGIWGDARVFFLAFIFMSGLLMSTRAGINAIVISLLSLTFFGFLILNGFFVIGTQEVTNGSLGDWLTGTASLVLLGSVAIAGLYLFQSEFVKAQSRANESYKELQIERNSLEKHVADRTGELEKRNASMRSMVYFTRQIAEIQDPSAIPSRIVDLVTQHFGYYHASLFLIAEDGKSAVLQASSSDEGRKLLEKGYRLNLGDRSVLGRVVERAKLIVTTKNSSAPAMDVGELELPRTQSEITLPLVVRGKVIGVLDIQSELPQAFDQNEAEILQLLADQIGASIENARLLNRSQAIAKQMETQNSRQTQSSWRDYLINQRLAFQFTPMGIKSITPGSKLNENSLQIPLILRGQEIGSIALQRKDLAEWSDLDRDLVRKVANQVALALDNSRLLEETRQHAVQEQTVNEISSRFNRSLDVDTLLQTAVRELAALPEVAEASVFIKPSVDNK